MSIKHEKKLVNRFLQDAASAGIRSLQITIEIKLCQTKSMERTLERKRNYAAVLRERLLAIKHTLLFVSRKISCRHDITNFDQNRVPSLSISHNKSKRQTSAFLPKNLIKLLNQELHALFIHFKF